MIYLVVTVHIIVAIFLILVVLLQRGAGADLSVFGGGGTQAAFGARSAATLLHKLTVWSFVAFTLTTISYNFLASHRDRDSVLSEAAGVAAVEAVASEGAAEDVSAEVALEPADDLVPSSAEGGETEASQTEAGQPEAEEVAGEESDAATLD